METKYILICFLICCCALISVKSEEDVDDSQPMFALPVATLELEKRLEAIDQQIEDLQEVLADKLDITSIPQDGQLKIHLERLSSNQVNTLGDLNVTMEYTGGENWPRRLETRLHFGPELSSFLREAVRGAVPSHSTPQSEQSTPASSQTSGSSTTPTEGQAVWGSWGEWGGCDGVCGAGTRNRHRVCPTSGQCEGKSTETAVCVDTHFCKETTTSSGSSVPPVPSPPGSGPWTKCSVTCGEGTRTRQALIEGRVQTETETCVLDSCDPDSREAPLVVNEGASARLHCSLEDKVSASIIQWINPDGHEVHGNNRYNFSRSYLYIVQTEAKDQGTYHCVVLGADGKPHTADATLMVRTCMNGSPCGDHGDCIEMGYLGQKKFEHFVCKCHFGYDGRFCENGVFSLSSGWKTAAIVLIILVILAFISAIMLGVKKGHDSAVHPLKDDPDDPDLLLSPSVPGFPGQPVAQQPVHQQSYHQDTSYPDGPYQQPSRLSAHDHSQHQIHSQSLPPAESLGYDTQQESKPKGGLARIGRFFSKIQTFLFGESEPAYDPVPEYPLYEHPATQPYQHPIQGPWYEPPVPAYAEYTDSENGGTPVEQRVVTAEPQTTHSPRPTDPQSHVPGSWGYMGQTAGSPQGRRKNKRLSTFSERDYGPGFWPGMYTGENPPDTLPEQVPSSQMDPDPLQSWQSMPQGTVKQLAEKYMYELDESVLSTKSTRGSSPNASPSVRRSPTGNNSNSRLRSPTGNSQSLLTSPTGNSQALLRSPTGNRPSPRMSPIRNISSRFASHQNSGTVAPRNSAEDSADNLSVSNPSKMYKSDGSDRSQGTVSIPSKLFSSGSSPSSKTRPYRPEPPRDTARQDAEEPSAGTISIPSRLYEQDSAFQSMGTSSIPSKFYTSDVSSSTLSEAQRGLDFWSISGHSSGQDARDRVDSSAKVNDNLNAKVSDTTRYKDRRPSMGVLGRITSQNRSEATESTDTFCSAEGECLACRTDSTTVHTCLREPSGTQAVELMNELRDKGIIDDVRNVNNNQAGQESVSINMNNNWGNREELTLDWHVDVDQSTPSSEEEVMVGGQQAVSAMQPGMDYYCEEDYEINDEFARVYVSEENCVLTNHPDEPEGQDNNRMFTTHPDEPEGQDNNHMFTTHPDEPERQDNNHMFTTHPGEPEGQDNNHMFTTHPDEPEGQDNNHMFTTHPDEPEGQDNNRMFTTHPDEPEGQDKTFNITGNGGDCRTQLDTALSTSPPSELQGEQQNSNNSNNICCEKELAFFSGEQRGVGDNGRRNKLQATGSKESGSEGLDKKWQPAQGNATARINSESQDIVEHTVTVSVECKVDTVGGMSPDGGMSPEGGMYHTDLYRIEEEEESVDNTNNNNNSPPQIGDEQKSFVCDFSVDLSSDQYSGDDTPGRPAHKDVHNTPGRSVHREIHNTPVRPVHREVLDRLNIHWQINGTPHKLDDKDEKQFVNNAGADKITPTGQQNQLNGQKLTKHENNSDAGRTPFCFAPDLDPEVYNTNNNNCTPVAEYSFTQGSSKLFGGTFQNTSTPIDLPASKLTYQDKPDDKQEDSSLSSTKKEDSLVTSMCKKEDSLVTSMCKLNLQEESGKTVYKEKSRDESSNLDSAVSYTRNSECETTEARLEHELD